MKKEEFKNPDNSFRGVPFWAWNCELEEDKLLKQINIFKEMGFGGFVIHVREGLTLPYLKEEFMDKVRFCVEEAKRIGLKVWLYDEDRWPSGSAGGYVTKNPEYRQRFLRVTREQKMEEAYAVYTICLNEKGELENYIRGNSENGTVWNVYLETSACENRYNGYTNVDVMKAEAIDKFIEVTHEAYKRELAKEFGETVPVMFTDEPQLVRKTMLSNPWSEEDVILPWTEDFPQSYQEEYGSDIMDFLPELIWELLGNRISKARYNYHNHACDRFVRCYCKKCGAWCEENHLTLTGHFHQEGGLFSQTHTNGDVMRGYVYFQMPGMDVLRDDIELTTAKQVQSVVNQYGGKGMMSEEYGVTNWDFDFRGHKFQGDWQAALGVTVRVPHLTWMSMKGSAKRDYPASIGLQSPWYTEYSYIENHFARLNYALQDTKVEIHVGVIHPIESFWLYWGTDTQTGDKRCQREKEFSNLVEWLLLGLVDFDFINEALLNSAPGPIEAKEYDTIIVPNCKILRKTTVEFLEKYQKSGGKVLFLEEKPEYIDAEQKSISEICPGAEVMAFAKEAVLDSLKDCRVVDIRQDGERCNNLLCSIRENSDGKWLFIAHGKKHENRYTSQAQNIEIQIKGEYLPTMYDTITGEVKPLVYEWIAGKTIIQDKLYEFDSILIRLEKEVRTAGMQKEKMQPVICGEEMIPDTVSYELEEPNVLLLDRAEYSYMTEEIAPFEEVLRIDSKCRERAGLPPTGAKLLQPWCEKDEKNYSCVRLIFHIDSEIELEKAWLAFEEAEEILLNDMPVVMDICGYYVDDAIKKVKLPKLYKGENILRVSVPFGKRRSVEPMYLLGNFGVKVKGTDIRLTEKTKLLEFCTVTKQGFPFYGGNVIYHWRVEAKQDCIAKITVPYYVGALVKVWIDEKATGVIVNPPYSLMADMEQGIHDIRLQLFGNRHNTFGSLHNCSDDTYYGPPHWLAKGEAWTYEYLIKDMGILKKPVIELYAKN